MTEEEKILLEEERLKEELRRRRALDSTLIPEKVWAMKNAAFSLAASGEREQVRTYVNVLTKIEVIVCFDCFLRGCCYNEIWYSGQEDVEKSSGAKEGLAWIGFRSRLARSGNMLELVFHT